MANTKPVKQTRSNRKTNREDFLVANHASIVQKLHQIAKANRVITAFFDDGVRSMNTAILDVLHDMDLIVLDACLNETTNQHMLKADRLIFKTTMDGVEVQFSVNSIMKAKFQEQAVFAIPIPDRMLWVQRRDYYRISAPEEAPVHIDITNEAGDSDSYRVLDISVGGLSIQDNDNRLELDPGTLLECHLHLPENGHADVTLEVRNRIPFSRRRRDAGQRLGCAFVDLNMSFASNIQRYIHTLDLMRKRAQKAASNSNS